MIQGFIRRLCSPAYQRQVRRDYPLWGNIEIYQPIHFKAMRQLIEQFPKDVFDRLYQQHQGEYVLSYYHSYQQVKKVLEEIVVKQRNGEGLVQIPSRPRNEIVIWEYLITDDGLKQVTIKEAVVSLLSLGEKITTAIWEDSSLRSGYHHIVARLREAIMSVVYLALHVLSWFYDEYT